MTGATGDDTRTLHDTFLAAVAHSLREAKITFRGSGNGSCARIFSHLMHAFGADEETRRLLNGIIAEFLVDFSSAASSPLLGESESGTDLDGTRTLFNGKTLACGATYKQFRGE